MSSNSDSSNKSESDDQTKRVPELEHTGNKSEKAPEKSVIKKSLDEKITEALNSVSPNKRQTKENLTIKVVPLNIKLSRENFSYYKITTQVIENSILKTIVTPIQNVYEQEGNEEIRASLNRTFITCSRHLKFLLGALSPAYRPQLTTREHSQPVLRKISSQKELNKCAENLKNINRCAENLKNIDSVATLPQSLSKTYFTKLIFGAVTPSCAAKQHQEPPSVKEKGQQQESLIPEPAMPKAPEIKMKTQDHNTSLHSLHIQRPKLYKMQYKHVTAMKTRNDKELKIKEKLLKLLLHLRNTAEETENIIQALYQQKDTEHLQEFVNTQLNKTTSSDEYEYAHKKSLESLEKQSAAHLSAEAKRLKETEEHQQKVDTSKAKQKDVNVPLSQNDENYTNTPKDVQSLTFIRSTTEIFDQSKPADTSSMKSERNVSCVERQILPSNKQKPIKIILQKVEHRKKTTKLWNNKDYILNNESHRNNGPPIPEKQNERTIQEHKTDFIEKQSDTLNEPKSESSSKMSKEKAELHSSLECTEHPKEKPLKEKEEIVQEHKAYFVEKQSDKLNEPKRVSSSKMSKEKAERHPSLERMDHPKEKPAKEKEEIVQEHKAYFVEKQSDTLNEPKRVSSSKMSKEKAERHPSLERMDHPKEKPAKEKEEIVQEHKAYFVEKQSDTLNEPKRVSSSKMSKEKVEHHPSLECTDHPKEKPAKEKEEIVQEHKAYFVEKQSDTLNEPKRVSSSKMSKEKVEHHPSLECTEHPKEKTVKEKEEKIQEHKAYFVEKQSDILNEHKRVSSSKICKEKAEHHPSLECTEHPKEKPVKGKQEKIQEHKTYFVDKKPYTLNETQWGSSSKIFKEKAEKHPSLGCAEHPKEKPVKEKEKKIQDHKIDIIQKQSDAINKTKSGSSSKIFKEKAEYGPSLVHSEHPMEKSDKEEYKINSTEQTGIIEKSIYPQKPQTDKDKLASSKYKIYVKEYISGSKIYNKVTNNDQLISLPPKTSVEEPHTTERQNIKFKENEDQNDKEKRENATARKNQEEQKINQKVSKSKMASAKAPAVKRERLRLSRTIRQKGRAETCCKPRAPSQNSSLIANVNKANLTKSIKSKEHTENKLNERKATDSVSNNSATKSIKSKEHTENKLNERKATDSVSNNSATKSIKSKEHTENKLNERKATGSVSNNSATKSIKSKEHTENKLNERKATGSVSNNSADKNKPKETEAKQKALPQKNEKPISSNESNIDMPKPEKQKADLLKSNSTTVPETSPKSQSSKGNNSSSNKNEDSKNENQKPVQERNALKRKLDINKKIVKDRAAAKAELKEIELQRKQELQALKEKLTRPRSSLSKTDTYYEYLLKKLKEVAHKKELAMKVKNFNYPTKKYKTSVVNKKAKNVSVSLKYATERQKLDKHKSKVLSQKKIDECFKCPCCSDKPKNYSEPEVTPMPKYGCQHSSSKYEDIKSVKKMKTSGSSSSELPQKAKLFKATPKSHNSKPILKEVKFTPTLKPLVENVAENDNQKSNKTASCIENKAPEIQCADEKINNVERKSKAKCITKASDQCKSIQTDHDNLVCTVLNSNLQKGSSDSCKKQLTHSPKTDLKYTNERVKDLYLFTATDLEKQAFENEHYNLKKSINEMTMLKSSFCTGMKHKQELKTSLQNKLKRMRCAAKNQKADELKAKQVIKKTLLTNIHEAIKVKDLKDGFRNNFHWCILKTGIKNSFHGRQLLNAVKQSLKTLGSGLKGSVNSKELQLAFREGIKHRELFCVVRQSLNIPLLFKSLAGATKEYTKLKYRTFKKIHEESSKKNGGDNNGACSVPKQPPGESSSCSKQKGDVKHQVTGANKSQMYHLTNTINEEIAAQPLLMKDIRKLMTEILGSFPTLSLKNAEYLQLSHIHKYISKHFPGQTTDASYTGSRPMLKSIPTSNELAPFALKSSDKDDTAKQKSLSPNQKETNASRAVSKEVKYFQGFWQNYGPKIAVRGQTNNDVYSKQNALQQLNAMTKAIYETDRNAFTSGLSRRLSLNQFLRDFFSPNEHSSNDRKAQSNEAVSEKSPEEALRKLINDNMHTVNKICISENSVHNANNTLKDKILMFCLKHDMIYVAEDIPKPLIPPISESKSNKQNHISANIQEIQSSSHKDSDPIFPKGTTETLHSSVDKGSANANVTDKEEKPKAKSEKIEPKPEHVTITKPEKLIQHGSNDANLTGLAKYFNSETISGRANVAKATLSCIALGYLYYRASARSKHK